MCSSDLGYEFYDWLNKKPGVTLSNITETDGDINLHVVNTADPNTGIDSVDSETISAPVYYNLQGQRVTSPRAGDILIRQSAGKTEKVMF